MIAADAVKGLLAIDADRRVTVLTDRVSANDPIGYANSVVVAPDGTIYFTTSSTRFSPAQWGGTYEASVLDILEQSATGRVLAYDPATGKNAHRGPWLLLRQRDRPVVRRPHFVRERDRPLSPLEDRRPGERPQRAKRLAAGEDPARQPSGLSGQPDARTRWPHLGRAVQAAQSGGGQARRQAVLAKDTAASAAVAVAARRSRTDTSSPSTRTAASPPTFRTRAAPIPKPRASTETADRLYIHSLHAHGIGWLPR